MTNQSTLSILSARARAQSKAIQRVQMTCCIPGHGILYDMIERHAARARH